MKPLACLALAAAALLAGCADSSHSAPPAAAAPAANADHTWSEAELAAIQARFGATEVTASGLRYTVVRPGNGPKPTPGSMVQAHYHGTFLDGRVFDSSVQRGSPFAFRVGVRQVIQGWDEAFAAMSAGEKRVIIVPWWLAYGENGRPGRIPPRSALVFEVELLGFEQTDTVPGAASS